MLLLFNLTPSKFKPVLILFASICFYIYGTPLGLLVVLASSIIDFYIVRSMSSKPAHEKLTLLKLVVILNLAVLAYMKYTGFLVEEANRLLLMFGQSSLEYSSLLLPLGISFITFHKISYAVDIYRSKATSASLSGYLAYVFFFPKLLIGPIVNYSDFDAGLIGKGERVNNTYFGLLRFCRGLAKKILIADTLALTANSAFALDSGALTPELAWAGAICYTFQIYFDFSGYTDMALGTAQMLGVKLPENFRQPYLATSFTDFWRRWHITLSGWFREYVYIPLGGNRASELKTYRNLWIVFLLSGLWHGAGWNFIIWGAFHGLFLTLDKLGWHKILGKLRPYLSLPLTFVLLVISWVFFRADGLGHAIYFLKSMAGLGAHEPTKMLFANIIDNRGIFTLALAAFLSFIPLGRATSLAHTVLKKEKAREFMHTTFYLLIFLLSLIVAASNTYSPFIYLEF